MLNRDYSDQNCSAARALELVGERWSLLILSDAAFHDMTRFSEFKRSLGIASNVLASRLQGFVREGLMTTATDTHSWPRYHLTEKGAALKPAIAALTAWGDEWTTPYARPVRFLHAGCGGEVTVKTSCATCDATVAAAHLMAAPQENGSA